LIPADQMVLRGLDDERRQCPAAWADRLDHGCTLAVARLGPFGPTPAFRSRVTILGKMMPIVKLISSRL
jgi:hypothetical protein